MPEHDQKERVIGGSTVEAQDEARLAQVRADFRNLVREKKGLPSDPINLDADVLSGLTNSSVIDNPTAEQTPEIIPIDTAKRPASDSIVGLSVSKKRLAKIEQTRAA